MQKRTAGLDLEWAQWSNVEWGANLPAIPGYPGTQTEGNVYAVVGPSSVNGDVYGFHIYISISYDDNIGLDNVDFDIPGGTPEEMMQAVDNLSLRDIENMLDEMGYGPIDNPTASRHSSYRAAHLDLQWYEELDDYDHLFYYADLPEVPGYTDAEESESYAQVYLMEDYSDIPQAPGYEKGAWGFHLFIDGVHDIDLYADDFGLPAVKSAEEAMTMADNLSMQDIIRVCDALQA